MSQQNPRGTEEITYRPQFRAPIIVGGLGLLLLTATATLAFTRRRQPRTKPTTVDRDAVWMQDVATAFDLGKQLGPWPPPDESAA